MKIEEQTRLRQEIKDVDRINLNPKKVLKIIIKI